MIEFPSRSPTQFFGWIEKRCDVLRGAVGETNLNVPQSDLTVEMLWIRCGTGNVVSDLIGRFSFHRQDSWSVFRSLRFSVSRYEFTRFSSWTFLQDECVTGVE